MNRILLLRYDVEAAGWKDKPMDGFLEKAVEAHRRYSAPCGFFCTGMAIEAREPEFKSFWREVKGDPLFDIQDHSYSHIGAAYENSPSVETLKADYEKSFAVHERVFGRRPLGVSLCGVSGCGSRLAGFDLTEKSRAELDMFASLGVRIINSLLSSCKESSHFINYASLGHPEIMGYPSGNSDMHWIREDAGADHLEPMLAAISKAADAGGHAAVVLHDWISWCHASDKELSHVGRLADFARGKGFTLKTHSQCHAEKSLWA